MRNFPPAPDPPPLLSSFAVSFAVGRYAAGGVPHAPLLCLGRVQGVRGGVGQALADCVGEELKEGSVRGGLLWIG